MAVERKRLFHSQTSEPISTLRKVASALPPAFRLGAFEWEEDKMILSVLSSNAYNLNFYKHVPNKEEIISILSKTFPEWSTQVKTSSEQSNSNTSSMLPHFTVLMTKRSK
jgi:hypothetical protein